MRIALEILRFWFKSINFNLHSSNYYFKKELRFFRMNSKKKAEKMRKISPYLTLKLVNGKTEIFIKGRKFKTCKYLLINISSENVDQINKFDSIDEVSQNLDRSLERSQKFKITPETEFWGHCSNLEAWIENNYDTRLLHRNLAFPLLKALTEAGDQKAKKILKEEIARRFLSLFPPTMIYLAKGNYLLIFSKEEFSALLEQLRGKSFQKELLEVLKNVAYKYITHRKPENAYQIIRFFLKKHKFWESAEILNLIQDLTINFANVPNIAYVKKIIQYIIHIEQLGKKEWIFVFLEKIMLTLGKTLEAADVYLFAKLVIDLYKRDKEKGFLKINLELGKMLLDNEKYSSAKKILEQIFNLPFEKEEIWRLLGYTYFYLEEYHKSGKLLAKYLKNNKKAGKDWKILGDIYYHQNQKERALTAYLYAMESTPQLKRIFFKRAHLFYIQGEHHLAKQILKKLGEIHPKYIYPWNYLGYIYTQEEKYGKAIKILTKINSNELANNLAHLGFSYYKNGNKKKGIEYLKKCKTIKPKYSRSYKYLGKIYLAKEDYEKALDHYYTFLDLESNNPSIWKDLPQNINDDIKILTRKFENNENYQKKVEELEWNLNKYLIRGKKN